eukprot:scaffold189719_cov24-Tisochrysis_lutea.AAC.2
MRVDGEADWINSRRASGGGRTADCGARPPGLARHGAALRTRTLGGRRWCCRWHGRRRGGCGRGHGGDIDVEVSARRDGRSATGLEHNGRDVVEEKGGPCHGVPRAQFGERVAGCVAPASLKIGLAAARWPRRAFGRRRRLSLRRA